MEKIEIKLTKSQQKKLEEIHQYEGLRIWLDKNDGKLKFHVSNLQHMSKKQNEIRNRISFLPNQ